MVYSYVTYSKQGEYFYLVFENAMEPDQFLKITFKPYNHCMIFSSENIDLQSIKMRDPEVILAYIEAHGLTLITEGL